MEAVLTVSTSEMPSLERASPQVVGASRPDCWITESGVAQNTVALPWPSSLDENVAFLHYQNRRRLCCWSAEFRQSGEEHRIHCGDEIAQRRRSRVGFGRLQNQRGRMVWSWAVRHLEAFVQRRHTHAQIDGFFLRGWATYCEIFVHWQAGCCVRSNEAP